jgi:hypothetical protein
MNSTQEVLAAASLACALSMTVTVATQQPTAQAPAALNASAPIVQFARASHLRRSPRACEVRAHGGQDDGR